MIKMIRCVMTLQKTLDKNIHDDVFLMQVYAREVDKHKRTMLLVNKADLLPVSVRLVFS